MYTFSKKIVLVSLFLLLSNGATSFAGITTSTSSVTLGETYNVTVDDTGYGICVIDKQETTGDWTNSWAEFIPPSSFTNLSELDSGTVTYRLTCYENGDKSGNVTFPLFASITVTRDPDLTADSVTTDDQFSGSLRTGIPTTFESVIRNIGTDTTGSSFNVFFQIEKDAVITDMPATSTASLSATGARVVTYTHLFSENGFYSVRTCADKSSSGDLGLITEKPSSTAEDNNCSFWQGFMVRTAIGTLDVTPLSCVIPVGESSCQYSATWSTGYPIGTPAVTRNNPDNTTVFTGYFGTAQNFTLTGEFPATDMYLYDAGQLLSGPVTVTTSCSSGGWDTISSTCVNPQISYGYSSGNWYLAPGVITFELTGSDAYEIYTSPLPSGNLVATGTYSGVTNVEINQTANFVIYARNGSYRNPVPFTVRYDLPPPPPPTITLSVYPKSVTKDEDTVVSWDIEYPTEDCQITAKAVCTNNICTPDQTSFEDDVNTILTSSSTDINDPNTTRPIQDALKYFAPGYEEPLWRALGKKTFNVEHSMEFTLTCDGITKETRRVQVVKDSSEL